MWNGLGDPGSHTRYQETPGKLILMDSTCSGLNTVSQCSPPRDIIQPWLTMISIRLMPGQPLLKTPGDCTFSTDGNLEARRTGDKKPSGFCCPAPTSSRRSRNDERSGSFLESVNNDLSATEDWLCRRSLIVIQANISHWQKQMIHNSTSWRMQRVSVQCRSHSIFRIILNKQSTNDFCISELPV